MKLKVTKTPLEGVLVVNIDHQSDERGFFLESWQKRDFAEAGIRDEFVQDSHSRSRVGTLRGMHYQDMRAPMSKLVRCTVGRIFDVAVDLRSKSPTLGQWFGIELSPDNKTQLYVPIGFAHGFLTLSDVCEVQYKQSGFYRPDSEGGIAWNDPTVAISWTTTSPILSRRDQANQSFNDYLKSPVF